MEIKAFDMAIKALEQEVILDKIRTEIKCMEYIEGSVNNSDEYEAAKEDALEIIDKYRQVEQEPKTGRWIETAEEYYKAVNEYGGGVNENTPYFVDDIACSECLAKYSVIDNETERFDHCPSCGAKMLEPQESEG